MTIARRKFLAGSAIGIAALAMPAVRTSAAARKITLRDRLQQVSGESILGKALPFALLLRRSHQHQAR